MGSPQLAKGFLLYSTTREIADTLEPTAEIFDTTALRDLYEIHATCGKLACKMKVAPRIQNRMGNLHGGCIATIVDVVGTGALLTMNPRGGVSLNINTNYLDAIHGGSVVLIEAEVLRVGRTIAVINVDLRDEATGKLRAQGTHIKFISETEPDLSKLVKGARSPPKGQLLPRSKL